MAEEAGGDAGFALQAGRCQDIGVVGFVGALFEVTGFDQPLVIRALRQ